MRTQTEIAGRMYYCRKAAKTLFADEYEQKIQPYRAIIKAHCCLEKLEVLPVLVELCNDGKFKDDGMAVMLFMAAAVEIIQSENA